MMQQACQKLVKRPKVPSSTRNEMPVSIDEAQKLPQRGWRSRLRKIVDGGHALRKRQDAGVGHVVSEKGKFVHAKKALGSIDD